jgi:hypothetical protein
VLGITLDKPLVKIWNFSDEGWEAGKTKDGLTLGSSLTIQDNQKKLDDLVFTKRIKTNSDISLKKSVSFDVVGPCNIRVYGMSTTTDVVRSLVLMKDSPDENGEIVVVFGANDGNSIEAYDVSYTGEAATLYIGSTEGSYSLYAITVTYPESYYVGSNNVEYLLTQSNFESDEFFTQGEKNRWTYKAIEDPYGECYIYNMAKPTQYIEFNVTGARDFKVLVENGTAGRHYSVQINNEEPVVVEHPGLTKVGGVWTSLAESQVFHFSDPYKVNKIKIAGHDGGGNSVYPMSLIFNSDMRPFVNTAPKDATYTIGSETYPSFSVKATSLTLSDMTYMWYFYNGGSMTSLEFEDGADPATLSKETLKPLYFNAFKSLVLNKAGEHEIYCRITDENGSTITKATLTVVAPSTECRLTSVKFDNNAFGAITEPGESGNGTIDVPYTEGTDKPGIYFWSPEVSEGATADYDDTKVTVTAEDGITQAVYDINYVAVTPVTVTEDSEGDFTEVPSWVYNRYGYDETNGVKFAKAENSDATETEPEDYRISQGKTRQYYFVGPAKQFTLYKAENSTTRKVSVTVNGSGIAWLTDVDNDEITVDLDEYANNIILIESAQTEGDGGFGSYAIVAAEQPPVVQLNKYGYATFSYHLNVAIANNDPASEPKGDAVKVYCAESVQNNKIVMSELEGELIPAESGVLLKGTPNAVVNMVVDIYSPAEIFNENHFYPTTTGNGLVPVPEVSGSSNALTLDGNTFKTFIGDAFTPYKAYLLKSWFIEETGSTNNNESLEIVFKDKATAITNVNDDDNSAAHVKVVTAKGIKIGNYTIAGQKVK